MGRKSKLTPDQWAEVERRLLEGESRRAVGRDFGISETAISLHVKGPVEKLKSVAEKIVVAEVARAALTPIQRNTADNLAAKLMSISNSLAAAGELGAKTAHRLNALANSEVGKIDDSNPLGSRENLQGVAVLTKLANDSASIALNLLAANKATVEQMNNEKPPEEEPPLRPQISRDEWLKLHGHA